MISNKKYINRILLILILSALFLSACTTKRSREEALKKEAIVLIDEKKYEEASDKIEEAIKLRNSGKIDRSKLDLLKYRAELQFLMGEYEKAEASYALLCDIDSETKWYNYMRIISIVRGSKDIDKARALYDKIKDTATNEAAFEDAKYEFITLMMEQNESIEEVLSYYEVNMNDESRSDARVYNNIANIYFHYKEYDKALYYYDRGIAYVDGLSEPLEDYNNIKKNIIYNKACLYEFMHDYSKALETFNTYRDAYGSDENIEHEIEFLKSRIR